MKRVLAVGSIAVLLSSIASACSDSSSSSSGTGGGDAGSSGKTCVTIDPATYDRSCTQDSDCMIVPTGQLCTGQCGCGGTPINKKESTRYQAAASSVKLEACPCASPGSPRCVQSACLLCAFGPTAAPGCPDGG